jgi:serine protease Do
MPLYDFPTNQKQGKKIKIRLPEILKNRFLWFAVLIVFLAVFFGFLAGAVSGSYFYLKTKDYLAKLNIKLPENKETIVKEYVPQTTQEEAIISAVKQFSPAVVSIIISKDVPIMEQYYINPFNDPFFQIPQYRQNGTKKEEIGGGTGFMVSADGLILTNKHVVSDDQADYTVFTNDGKKYPAKVLAKDPVQDLAIIKIEKQGNIDFPVVKLGDSDSIQIGQSVIAIGNALGEFRNTVSVGVVSGLGRTISASGGSGFSETLEDIIQTDAAINPGNSGGPLLNLAGEVIGINTAIAEQAQNIGFAIPINRAKKDISQVGAGGKIVYPFLGIRYVLVTDTVKKENNLSVDYGAFISKGDQGEAAIQSGSAAEKAGLKEGDVVLEFNGEKITQDNSLAKIITKYNPGDKISLRILRDNKEQTIEVVLGERTQ